MSQSTKRHHYLPRFYLAGFTDTGTKDGQLTVFHLLEHHTFRTRPDNVGVESHFNRVELPGVEPDAIEKALAPVEGRMAAVLREIVATERLPEGEDMAVLLNLVALMHVRNPGSRESIATSEEQLMRVVADLMISTPEIYESTVRGAREAGVDVPGDVSFEQMRDYVRRSELELERATTREVFREIEALDPVIHALADRKWSLLVSAEEEAEFICCDHPVALTWQDRAPHPLYPPGLGLKNTLVVVPLTKKLCLWSLCDGPHGTTVPVTADIVSTANRIVLTCAQRFAYAASEQAPIQWDDGHEMTLPQIMQETRARQEHRHE